MRLGDGVPLALSPDKQWVLSTPVAGDRLVLLPTGVGQPRTLPTGPIASYFPAARFLPDGQRFLVSAAEKDRPNRIYLQSIDGGDPQPVTAEGVFGRIAVLPDGEHFVTRGTDRRLAVFAIGGGEPRPLAGAERAGPADRRQRRRRVAVRRRAQRTCRPRWRACICGPDGASRCARCCRPIRPARWRFCASVMTPDARAYAYTFVRALSALYLVDGLR